MNRQAKALDAGFVKPFDQDSIVDIARRTGAVVPIEDHSEVGGPLSIAADTLARAGVVATALTGAQA